ncbi:nascent polypeptide-associated complex protein [Candidatus Woesearchaeota archaeon]|nr:MAG: nascent polypeptide-associated complex protein [Candidatus Woesearchaeota archaeon]
MLPGMNPKMLKQAMKKMGVKQQEIDAYEVIIKTNNGDYVIKNPEVMKINMMGQESLQVVGDMQLVENKIKEDDVKLVMEQTNCSEEEAVNMLKKTSGDIAQAILELTQS